LLSSRPNWRQWQIRKQLTDFARRIGPMGDGHAALELLGVDRAVGECGAQPLDRFIARSRGRAYR
jgi:hypothetical protein